MASLFVVYFISLLIIFAEHSAIKQFSISNSWKIIFTIMNVISLLVQFYMSYFYIYELIQGFNVLMLIGLVFSLGIICLQSIYIKKVLKKQSNKHVIEKKVVIHFANESGFWEEKEIVITETTINGETKVEGMVENATIFKEVSVVEQGFKDDIPYEVSVKRKKMRIFSIVMASLAFTLPLIRSIFLTDKNEWLLIPSDSPETMILSTLTILMVMLLLLGKFINVKTIKWTFIGNIVFMIMLIIAAYFSFTNLYYYQNLTDTEKESLVEHLREEIVLHNESGIVIEEETITFNKSTEIDGGVKVSFTYKVVGCDNCEKEYFEMDLPEDNSKMEAIIVKDSQIIEPLEEGVYSLNGLNWGKAQTEINANYFKVTINKDEKVKKEYTESLITFGNEKLLKNAIQEKLNEGYGFSNKKIKITNSNATNKESIVHSRKDLISIFNNADDKTFVKRLHYENGEYTVFPFGEEFNISVNKTAKGYNVQGLPFEMIDSRYLINVVNEDGDFVIEVNDMGSFRKHQIYGTVVNTKDTKLKFGQKYVLKNNEVAN